MKIIDAYKAITSIIYQKSKVLNKLFLGNRTVEGFRFIQCNYR